MMMTRKRRRVRAADDEPVETEADADNVVERDGTCVYFYSDVSRSTVCKLYKLLREAATQAMGGEVYLYIHSNGGDAYSGLSALDHLRAFRGGTIVTIADGFVASAATFLLLGGERRLAMPHSHVLIHQMSGMLWGKYDEMKDEIKNSTSLMKSMTEVYTSLTRMPEETVCRLLKNEVSLDARKCVKLGIVDSLEWAR